MSQDRFRAQLVVPSEGPSEDFAVLVMLALFGAVLVLTSVASGRGFYLGLVLLGIYPMVLHAMTTLRSETTTDAMVEIFEDGITVNEEDVRAEEVVGRTVYQAARDQAWLVYTLKGAKLSCILVFARAADAIAAGDALKGPADGGRFGFVAARPAGPRGPLVVLAAFSSLALFFGSGLGYYAIAVVLLLFLASPFLLFGYWRVVRRSVQTSEVRIKDSGIVLGGTDFASQQGIEVVRREGVVRIVAVDGVAFDLCPFEVQGLPAGRMLELVGVLIERALNAPSTPPRPAGGPYRA